MINVTNSTGKIRSSRRISKNAIEKWGKTGKRFYCVGKRDREYGERK